MKKTDLPVPFQIDTPNKKITVSFMYAWARQPAMSIHEQRVVLRIMEYASACINNNIQGTIKDNLHKIELGLWNVKLTIPTSDVIESGRTAQEIQAALDTLTDRSFTYEDDEIWWKCHYIEDPEVLKRKGLITFYVSNKLWKVFADLSQGYRQFELNKALALPTSYALQLYLLVCGQKKTFYHTVASLKQWLGIPEEKYRGKNGKDRIDNLVARVIEPAKKALDSSCPWTFTYTSVHENPKNEKSKVTGFLFYPKEQPRFKDKELEHKEMTAKTAVSFILDPRIKEYLTYSMGFTLQELQANKETFDQAAHKIPDFIGFLSELQGRRRCEDGSVKGKGWVINAIKSETNKH